MSRKPQVDAQTIGELALQVESDIDEAIQILTLLNVRVSKGTISKDSTMQRIGEALDALKR